jgi:hypothetical protein
MMFLSIIMFAAQAASEAIKQGPSSGQAVTWTAVAMAIVANVGTWLVILKRNPKKATSNPGHSPSVVKPGEGLTCREHGESISALEESKKNTDAALVRIEGKVDRLLERKG